ncbi:Alpha/Beta hydrolase protein [Lipomyces arxii]|uniref:Alpha/Beta hydrolase protein n=1 Tax=Lipomyces arxii TaxID=56418 RepID=UPI0034CFBC72
MRGNSVCAILALVGSVYGARPVVMWHGLGDSYNSGGMTRVTAVLKEVHEDIFVHSVYLDEDPKKDSNLSLLGKLDDQLAAVCEQLANIPELEDGFDGLGFSQGGLLLRAYVERCNKPRVHNLITFGSPQNGVAEIPRCRARDFACRQRNAILKSQVYSSYAQNKITAAQYFRDPERLDEYLEMSGFLADVNNERDFYNTTYADNLASLNKLVLYMFTEDKTVVPKESAWFADVDKKSGEVTPLYERNIYNRLGLNKLGDRIEMFSLEGRHMNITNSTVMMVAEKYLGSTSVPESVQKGAYMIDSNPDGQVAVQL